MPVEIFAQTGTNYEFALSIGPSQQISQILYAVSAPFSASYQLAKLDKAGAPYWDENDLTALGGENGSWASAYGVRFKSFDPTNPTTVRAIGLYADDPIPQGFTPSSSAFATSGETSLTGIQTGVILPYGGSNTPSGFVLCDGTHYDGTQPTYLNLWGVIGLTYGGTAQADFAVPDLRGRVPVGVAPGGKALVNARGKSDGLAENLRSISHHHGNQGWVMLTFPGGSSNAVNPNGSSNASGTAVIQTGDADNVDSASFLVIQYIIAL